MTTPDRDTPRRRPGWRRGRIAAGLGLVVLASSATSPLVRYLSHAAWSEVRILARRRPITVVIADPATAPAVRAQLDLVLAARQFAADSLGLRVKQSFTMYTKLDHDTLVLVLGAAYRDRLQPVTWWFPIVGQVPYKGFFDFAAAVRSADELRRQGFDAYVRPSPAFSTLGWFNDPVVSASLEADSADLATTVIHELTHNTFYASGQAPFNESFASFVGARGAERFFRGRGEHRLADLAAARWADEVALGGFWTFVARRLDSAFRAHGGADSSSRAARLAARDTIFRVARDSMTGSLAHRVRTIAPQVLARAKLDNAVLLARLVYGTDLDRFDSVYARTGRDLRRAIAQVIAIANARPHAPFAALEGRAR